MIDPDLEREDRVGLWKYVGGFPALATLLAIIAISIWVFT